jgi:deazaflavin-dependent oxidoreductase (nitroreductase family)
MASKWINTIWAALDHIHVTLYHMSSGKVANTVANLPVLLITTYGRKTGKPRTKAVVYIKDGKDYLVSASAGGADHHPNWFFNLKNNPEAMIEIGEQTLIVKAYITAGEERSQLYEKFKTASGNFEKYEKGTSRIIPVIRLSPTTN